MYYKPGVNPANATFEQSSLIAKMETSIIFRGKCLVGLTPDINIKTSTNNKKLEIIKII